MRPPRLSLTTMAGLLEWYRVTLCHARFIDPRGYRVRFILPDFVHFIKLTNKHGEEPRNRQKAIDEIRRGRMEFAPGRFDPQRASELSWIPLLAAEPDFICRNWQILGDGDECYVRNFGEASQPNDYRVLVCKTIGTVRIALTMFERDIGGKEKALQIWP